MGAIHSSKKPAVAYHKDLSPRKTHLSVERVLGEWPRNTHDEPSRQNDVEPNIDFDQRPC